MSRRSGFAVVALICLVSMNVWSNGETESGRPEVDNFYTFGGSDIGGVWFAIASTLTTQWNADIPSIMWSMDTRGGGTANAFWMATGEVEAAINNTPGIQSAMDGTGFFADRGAQDFSGVRVLAAMHKSYMTIVVAEDSDIEVLEDIRGRRVAIGQPGNSIQTILPQIFDVRGWSYEDDIQKEFIADYDAFDALRAGRIDAVVEWIGLGAGAYAENFQAGGMRLVPVSEETMTRLSERYPFYVAGEIPEGAYPGQGSTRVPFTQDFITVQASVDDDIVYQMCRTLHERLEDGTLQSTHRAFGEAGFPDYIEDISLVPIHRGAERFYNEIGVSID